MGKMSVAWYLGRIAWRGRWASLALLGVLAGLVGGVTMAAIAGVRRSDTAFDRLMAASGIPSLEVGSPTLPTLYPAYRRAIAGLDEVAVSTESWFFVGRKQTSRDWWSVRAFGDGDRSTPVLTAGRVPDPRAPYEVMVSVNTARFSGLGVGDSFVVDFYDRRQLDDIGDDTWTRPRGPRPRLHVVGIYRDPRDGARSVTGTGIIASRAFGERHAATAGIESIFVEPGPGGEAALRRAVDATNARVLRFVETFRWPTVEPWAAPGRAGERQSQGVIAWGLGGFAAVALLAGTVAHAQTVRRWLYPLERQQPMWRALGADGPQRRWSLVVAAAPHVVIAGATSALVAWLMSPRFPFGVIGDLEPTPGTRADVPVMVIGGVLTALAAAGVTAIVAGVVVRPRRRTAPARPVAVASSLESAGAPVPVTTGTRFVLRPGSTQRALPITTAAVAAVLTVGGTLAAAVFTSSLDDLASNPDRFGSAWDLSMELTAPRGPEAMDDLIADGRVAAVTEFVSYNRPMQVQGRPTTTSIVRVRKGRLELRVESGRPPTGPDEIVLGPKLLADLGRSVGDEVQVRNAAGDSARLTVVGTALSPLFESEAFNAEAFVSDDLAPRLRGEVDSDTAYPVTMVRFADDVDVAEVAAEYDRRYPYAVMSESFPAPPPEVRNVDELSVLPRMLAVFMALVGVAALVHAIVVGVRSRRQDLGVLRALGFTRGQTAAVVLAMTATIAVVGIAVGVPLGLFGGSTGWRLTSGALFVTPIVSWTWAAAAAISAGVLTGAVVIALLPARSAGHRPLAETLRSE